MAINVQLASDKLEKVLAILLESDFVMKQVKKPIENLVAYCNGYVISQYIIGLPIVDDINS